MNATSSSSLTRVTRVEKKRKGRPWWEEAAAYLALFVGLPCFFGFLAVVIAGDDMSGAAPTWAWLGTIGCGVSVVWAGWWVSEYGDDQ